MNTTTNIIVVVILVLIVGFGVWFFTTGNRMEPVDNGPSLELNLEGDSGGDGGGGPN